VTLPQARRRVWMFRLIGWAVLTLAVLVMVLVFLIYTYLNLPGGLIFQIPGRKLYDFTNQILATSPILSYIWRLTPTGDNQFLFLVLMSFLVWGFVGGKIVRYANNLSGRIRRARHAVEEERWRRSLGGVAGNIGTLSIQLESEEHWYVKPSGLLLIGLMIEVIGGLIVLIWGHHLFGP
jgi:hypothetical protein